MECHECGAHLEIARELNLYTARAYKVARCEDCGASFPLCGRNMRAHDVNRVERAFNGDARFGVFGTPKMLPAVRAFVEERGDVPKDDGFVAFIQMEGGE